MGRVKAFASVCLCLAVVAGSAESASAGSSTRPVRVLGPTESGLSLEVFDRDGELCGRVAGLTTGPDAPSCERPSGALREPLLGARTYGPGGAFSMWGLVASEVATVEVVLRGGRRLQVATVDGSAYQGRYAGVGRFFLASSAPKRGAGLLNPLYLRLLAADGRLLAVKDLGSSRRHGPAVTLARGVTAGQPWRLGAYAQRGLAPLPGDEERFSRQVCVGIFSSGGGSATCNDDGEVQRFTPAVSQDCDPLGTRVATFLPPRLRAIAVLGSGRRSALATYRLPRHLGGGRVAGGVIRRRTALRRIELVDRRGRRLRSFELRVAPARLNCTGFSGGLLFGFLEDSSARGPAPGAQPSLQLEERDGLLCVSLAGEPPSSVECGVPPLESEASTVLTLRLSGATFVAGVVPADVTQLRLELDGHGGPAVQTTTAGPSGGRWAGRFAVFTALVPGHPQITALRMRDVMGRPLGTLPGPDRAPFEIKPRPLLVSGDVRVAAGVVGRSSLGARRLCLSLLLEPGASASCGPVYQFSALDLTASCRPRALSIWGLVRKRTRALLLETSDGLVRARLRRLPADFGIEGKLALLTLPADTTPRTLTVVEERRRVRHVVPVTDARGQCGYHGQLLLRD